MRRWKLEWGVEPILARLDKGKVFPAPIDQVTVEVDAPDLDRRAIGLPRRQQAATAAAEWSGISGRACRCAAVASGAVGWRSAAELEMTTLSVPLDAVDTVLESFADFEILPNTGAGVLPIVEIEDR